LSKGFTGFLLAWLIRDLANSSSLVMSSTGPGININLVVASFHFLHIQQLNHKGL
jgi:hypothetical protein